MREVYEKKGEWSSYTVKRGKTGWIVMFLSQVQGEFTGRRVLVPYTCSVAEIMDPSSKWNEWMNLGDYVATVLAKDPHVRVLRHGWPVK